MALAAEEPSRDPVSSALWLVWPLVLFFPMWAAPLIVPGMQNNAEQAYVAMGQAMLPAGMIGLVLAGFFSHTMAMVSSDANVISAVITRDTLPRLWKGAARMARLSGSVTVAHCRSGSGVASEGSGVGVVAADVVRGLVAGGLVAGALTSGCTAQPQRTSASAAPSNP